MGGPAMPRACSGARVPRLDPARSRRTPTNRGRDAPSPDRWLMACALRPPRWSWSPMLVQRRAVVLMQVKGSGERQRTKKIRVRRTGSKDRVRLSCIGLYHDLVVRAQACAKGPSSAFQPSRHSPARGAAREQPECLAGRTGHGDSPLPAAAKGVGIRPVPCVDRGTHGSIRRDAADRPAGHVLKLSLTLFSFFPFLNPAPLIRYRGGSRGGGLP